MGILSIFRKRKNKPENILEYVHQNRGLLWENINTFKENVLLHNGSVKHHTPEMDKLMPITHYLKDVLYN